MTIIPPKKSAANRHAEEISRSSEDMPIRRKTLEYYIRKGLSYRNPKIQAYLKQAKARSKHNMKFFCLLLFIAIYISGFLSGCGIYNGGFQRGGELTSSFLDRIQETPKDQEDYLIDKEN